MGFLDSGTPLGWKESDAVRSYVKHHGLEQLLHLWRLNRDRRDMCLRWGDEVEFSLVDLERETLEARVYLDAADVIQELRVREGIMKQQCQDVRWVGSDWHPEFSNHMVESIPSPPFFLSIDGLLEIEKSMRVRRAKIQSILPRNKYVTSQTVFARFGVGDFYSPNVGPGPDPENGTSKSIFVPDTVINPHPRFPTLVGNIYKRRGAKPVISVPLFQDTATVSNRDVACQLASDASKQGSPSSSFALARPLGTLSRFEIERLSRVTENPLIDSIYMDCFAFGMSMCCLQMTFMCPDLSSARFLYDQLLVLAPLMLALTAATPVLRGLLANTDTRWQTLEQAVDCRTEDEEKRIPKSRYSGASLYISDKDPLVSHLEEWNNTEAPVDAATDAFLVEQGMDPILARHFAHLWIRDPIVIFSERIHINDSMATDHFENIQSTNWNSVRFKPPPPYVPSTLSGQRDESSTSRVGPIGWRVELRTPEVQMTDFENAACTAFVSLLAAVLLKHRDTLNLYIPMSCNDENMERSARRDAILKEKFFFRSNPHAGPGEPLQVEEMTLLEIFAGKNGGSTAAASVQCADTANSVSSPMPGLVSLCLNYVEEETTAGRCSADGRLKLFQYLHFLLERAEGKLMTNARFIRRFVQAHPDYRQDSKISPKICYDLTVLAANAGLGAWVIPHTVGLGNARLLSHICPPVSAESPFAPLSPDLPAVYAQFDDAGRVQLPEGVRVSSYNVETLSPYFFIKKESPTGLMPEGAFYACSADNWIEDGAEGLVASTEKLVTPVDPGGSSQRLTVGDEPGVPGETTTQWSRDGTPTPMMGKASGIRLSASAASLVSALSFSDFRRVFSEVSEPAKTDNTNEAKTLLIPDVQGKKGPEAATEVVPAPRCATAVLSPEFALKFCALLRRAHQRCCRGLSRGGSTTRCASPSASLNVSSALGLSAVVSNEDFTRSWILKGYSGSMDDASDSLSERDQWGRGNRVMMTPAKRAYILFELGKNALQVGAGIEGKRPCAGGASLASSEPAGGVSSFKCWGCGKPRDEPVSCAKPFCSPHSEEGGTGAADNTKNCCSVRSKVFAEAQKLFSMVCDDCASVAREALSTSSSGGDDGAGAEKQSTVCPSSGGGNVEDAAEVEADVDDYFLDEEGVSPCWNGDGVDLLAAASFPTVDNDCKRFDSNEQFDYYKQVCGRSA